MRPFVQLLVNSIGAVGGAAHPMTEQRNTYTAQHGWQIIQFSVHKNVKMIN